MLFSIITITRNNINGLRRTAASVESQSFAGYEWIIIDGNSGDGTKDYLQTLPAYKLSEADHGIYDAMNKGIAAANGFFIIFMNAGDCFADNHSLLNIASYIEEVQETPDFIYGDALEQPEIKDGNDDNDNDHDNDHDNNHSDNSNVIYKRARPYTKIKTGMFTHHQAMIYRRDLIGHLRYDIHYPIAADYKFTLQYLENCNIVLYAPFPLCLFSQGGISQQNAAQGRAEQFRIRQDLKSVSAPCNHLIRFLQYLNMLLRQRSPALYWALKKKRG